MCCRILHKLDTPALYRPSPLLDSCCCPAGLIQLFCMSTCLWTFGRYLERVLLVPILAVPAVYMVSGIAGGLASANLAVDRVTVTSTAAICGLVGQSCNSASDMQSLAHCDCFQQGLVLWCIQNRCLGTIVCLGTLATRCSWLCQPVMLQASGGLC